MNYTAHKRNTYHFHGTAETDNKVSETLSPRRKVYNSDVISFEAPFTPVQPKLQHRCDASSLFYLIIWVHWSSQW